MFNNKDIHNKFNLIYIAFGLLWDTVNEIRNTNNKETEIIKTTATFTFAKEICMLTLSQQHF